MIDRGDQNTRAAYNLSFSKQHAVKSRSPEIRTPLKPKGDRAVDDDFRLRHDAVKLVARRTRMNVDSSRDVCKSGLLLEKLTEEISKTRNDAKA